MARRTITLPQGLEEGVREIQIGLMQSEKRDVTFTEAVNWVLLSGLLRNAEAVKVTTEERRELLKRWGEGLLGNKMRVDAALDRLWETVAPR